MRSPACLRLISRPTLTLAASEYVHVRSLSNRIRLNSTQTPSQTSDRAPLQTSSTVDPAELSKFSAQAADWWHPNGSAAALHRLNPVRVAYIRSAIEKHCSSSHHRTAPDTLPKPLTGFEVLDVGCGGKRTKCRSNV